MNQISGAHNTLDKQTPSKPKKKQNSKGLAPSVVRFYNCIHVWDINSRIEPSLPLISVDLLLNFNSIPTVVFLKT